MKCELCGKNEAIHEYTEVVNGEKKLIHVCHECAESNGILDLPKTEPAPKKEKPTATDKAFSSDNPVISTINDIFSMDKIVKKCENCGWTYDKFKRKGRFGCPECYKAFRIFLVPILKEIHGSNEHAGKQPFESLNLADNRAIQRRREIDVLNKKLEMAVETESFEQAAEIRDMIQKLVAEIESEN